MKIGSIEGNDVIYNEDDDTVFCKNTTVNASSIVEAYESGLDRISLQKDLVMRKHANEFTLGCFTLTPQQSKLLIKQIKRCSTHKHKKQD